MDGREFSKNTLFSFLAKAIPTVIGLAYTWLIANVLGPEQYGIFTYITALFGGFFLMAMGGMLTDALFVFSAKYKSEWFYKKVLVTQQFIVFLIALPFLFAPDLVNPFFGIGENYLALLGVVLLWLTPFNTVLEFLFKGFNRFETVFQSVLLENATNLVLSYLLVFVFNWGLMGIFAAKFVSLIAGNLAYLLHFRKLDFKPERPSRGEIASFLGWNTAGDFFRQTNAQAFTVMAGGFLSPVTLGSYYVAQKAVNATVGFPTAAAAEVLLPHASQNADPEKLGRDTSRVIRISLLVSGAMAVGVALAVPILISWLFPQYALAGGLVFLFCISFLSNALTIPANILRGQNWMKALAGFQLLGLGVAVAAGIVLVPQYGASGLIVAQIVQQVVLGLAIIAWLKGRNIVLDIVPRVADVREIARIVRGLVNV